jgi:hypothetical protein
VISDQEFQPGAGGYVSCRGFWRGCPGWRCEAGHTKWGEKGRNACRRGLPSSVFDMIRDTALTVSWWAPVPHSLICLRACCLVCLVAAAGLPLGAARGRVRRVRLDEARFWRQRLSPTGSPHCTPPSLRPWAATATTPARGPFACSPWRVRARAPCAHRRCRHRVHLQAPAVAAAAPAAAAEAAAAGPQWAARHGV